LVVSSGVRAGEVPFLDLANADRDGQTLKITERLTRDGRRKRGTKTTYHQPPGKDHRTTIVPTCVVDELEELGILPGELMFQAPRGGWLNLNNFRNRVLKPAMDAARAQLGEDAGFVPWGLKDLRHTFATELFAANVPFTHVSHWMGHRARTMVDGEVVRVRSKSVDVYDHPSDVHIARATAVMSEYIGPVHPCLFDS
jgi:integrase